MFDVVLFEPEIPPNTGNIMRLCANTGARLHLIEPLGFKLEDKQLRRAGLDYREFASVAGYRNVQTFMTTAQPPRLFGITTKGAATYTDVSFEKNDAFIFGPETRGLPAEILKGLQDSRKLRIPMRPDSRSLNLANAVSVIVYEAWRQHDFK